MGSLAVVVLDIGLQHRSKMPFAQDENSIEALGANRSDEPFGIGVGLRCPPRRAQDLDPLGPEDLVEDWAEPLVPVMNQVADRCVAVFSRLGQVPGDLGAPGGVGGAVGHPTEEDLPRVQVDEEQDVEGVGCIYSTERTPSAKPLDLLVFGTRDREVNRALVITGTIDVAAKRSVERHEVGVP